LTAPKLTLCKVNGCEKEKERMYHEAVALLQKTRTPASTNVFEHLTRIVAKVIEEKRVDNVDLDDISSTTKKLDLDGHAPIPLAVPLCSDVNKLERALTFGELFSAREPEINPDTGLPVPTLQRNLYKTDNIVAHSALFDAVGVGLGQLEMYGVMLSLKKLAEKSVRNLKSIRFFGKIFGTQSDYFVFESWPNNAPSQTASGAVETPGSGTNKYAYWVCSGPGAEPILLPDVKPEEIAIARRIQKYFTGDLSAHVSCYPEFPGRESSYLRAQIARIAATTTVCPTGFFTVGEDETCLEELEDISLPDDLSSPSSWAHRYPHLKMEGRCYSIQPPEGGEDTSQEDVSEVSPPLLTGLEVDEDVDGFPAWSPMSSSVVAGVKNRVMGLRNRLWPGAYAVASGQAFSNIYVGHGVKNAVYFPVPPPAVSDEYEGLLVESAEMPLRPDEPKEDEEEDETLAE